MPYNSAYSYPHADAEGDGLTKGPRQALMTGPSDISRWQGVARTTSLPLPFGEGGSGPDPPPLASHQCLGLASDTAQRDLCFVSKELSPFQPLSLAIVLLGLRGALSTSVLLKAGESLEVRVLARQVQVPSLAQGGQHTFGDGWDADEGARGSASGRAAK
jgi:hypothetical protein